MRNFVVFFLIKIIMSVSGAELKKYSIQSDTSIGPSVSSIWLIQSYKFKSKFECLGQCNLKTDCYTATYSSDPSLLDNCALYSKYFTISELVSLKNTNLYSKEFQCKLKLNNFLIITNFN